METYLRQMVKEKKNLVLRDVNTLKSAINIEFSKLHRAVGKFNARFELFAKEVRSLLQNTTYIKGQLVKNIDFWLRQQKISLESLTRLLQSLDFRQVLKRGFSITVDGDGAVLKSVKRVKRGAKITTSLYDGKIGSEVLSISKK